MKWFLGPYGDVRALPCPELDVGLTEIRYGGVHQGLTGARVFDHTGHRTDYSMSFTNMDYSDVEWLDALYKRHIPGPLVLVSPLNRNRLSRLAASVDPFLDVKQGVSGTVTAWGWDPSVPPAIVCSRSLKLTTFTTGQKLWWDVKRPVPVLPSDVTLQFSVHMKAGGNTTIAQGVEWYDAMGGLISNPSASRSLTSTWTRFGATATPPGGAVSCVPYLAYSSTSAPVWVAAAQVEPGNVSTDWVPGGGSARVVVDQLTTTSHRFPLRSVNVSLLEV